MSVISIILALLVAFLVGTGGILDEFQFHQSLVTCILIELVTGNLEAGIILGGTLQMIALGWANIEAAVAPDTVLAPVASTIILVLGSQGVRGVPSAIAAAVLLAVADLFLAMIARTVAVPIVHMMDMAAKKSNIRQVGMLHIFAVCLRGIRVAIPAGALLFIPVDTVCGFLESMPAWLTDGMATGDGVVVAVGYVLIINMMAAKEVWPFFIIGLIITATPQLTLTTLGALGVALALIHLDLSEVGGSSGSNGGGNSDNPLGDILNDY